MTTSSIEHQNFIDWMKAMGMFLIVAGHVIGDPFSPFNQIAQPAYTKQLGVAFFVFVVGWGLANVRKPTLQTVYNRLFAIYFWGVFFALFFSGVFYVTEGSLQLSNYLPFFFGANLLFNNFPANPTTWYIGTYIHIVLIWFCWIRHVQITKRVLVISFVIENLVRVSFLLADQAFIAYMLFPNWLTVFLLGMYLHCETDKPSMKMAAFVASIWVCVAVAWVYIMGLLDFGEAFPIRDIEIQQPWASLLQSSLMSIVYLLSTWLFFQFARCVYAGRFIRFLARNTLVNFIIHLPIIFALTTVWSLWLGDFQPIERKIILIIMIYLGCSMVSELLYRVIPYESLRQPIWLTLRPAFVKLRLVSDRPSP